MNNPGFQRLCENAYEAVIPAKAGIHKSFVVNGFRAKPGMTNVLFGRLFRFFRRPLQAWVYMSEFLIRRTVAFTPKHTLSCAETHNPYVEKRFFDASGINTSPRIIRASNKKLIHLIPRLESRGYSNSDHTELGLVLYNA